nr:uncharacterized protein BN887_03056 [Melanopsichium pennsylvanicum 4]
MHETGASDASFSDASAAEGKEARRREGGKRRSDDHVQEEGGDGDGPIEIQLDIDDFLSVLRGDQGGSVEKKLAEKISQVLNQQIQRDTLKAGEQLDQAESNSNGEDRKNKENKKKQTTPEDLVKLYRTLMTAVTGDMKIKNKNGVKRVLGEEGNKMAAQQQQQQQQLGLRMEKVGDSLGERVKRFYEAKERDELDRRKKKV